MNAPTPNDEINNFIAQYRKIFISGIPELLNDKGAYLAFICIFSGIEALAGYCYPEENRNGKKFEGWFKTYFDGKYHPFTKELWELRNSLIHGFSPKHFALCHKQPTLHFSDKPPFIKVLNADSMYEDFKVAAEKYLNLLMSEAYLQESFQQHLSNSTTGGGFYVG
jgi:hypothetical protein